MLGQLRKRTEGAPLSQAELEQRRAAGRASAAKRRRTLGDYEREARAIPMLEEDEERDLIGRWKTSGDTAARDRVVGAHLRLAVSNARKLSGYGLSVDDLVAAGNVGLLQAAEKFDPSKGARFSTFAMPYIRGAQFEHVQHNWSIVRQGTNRDQKRLFFSLRREMQHVHDGLTDEKAKEIAERRGVKTEAVKDMAARLHGRDASLNARAGEEEDGEEWLDRLTSGEHAEDRLVGQETARIRRASAARAIAGLNDRERRVLAARWLRQPPATLQQIGASLGISAERVRQIENQAMRRVRAKVTADPRLAKRTPGAPLSDEELRQRREAARSRWATGGGALAGALAAGTAAHRRAATVARRAVEGDPDIGHRALALAERRRDRQYGRIVETLAERQKANSRGFTVRVAKDEARKGRPGPVALRARHLRARLANSSGQTEHLDARGELDELMNARPARKVPREGGVVTRRAAKWTRKGKPVTAIPGMQHGRDAHKVRLPSDLSRSRLREIRGALAARGEEQAAKARARVAARWPRAAPGLKDAFTARATRMLTRSLQRKWRVPALVAGAAAGAVAGYGATKLGKVAPPDDVPFPPEPEASTPVSSGGEAELANRLAVLFRSWLENPGRVGNRDDIAQALDPLYRILRTGADAAAPPRQPDDSLYGTPDDRVIAFNFDARSPEVERRLREYALDRIRAITEESRDTIRRVLVDAAQQGLPVDEQARRIREAIGLAPGQQAWVTSYRRQLEVLDPRVLTRALRDRRHDSPISRAIETGTPLPAEDIQRYVASYHRRALAYRSIMIARTEALRGANTAMVESTRVMLQENPEVTVEKTWIATDDDRTRDDHRELNGKVVLGLDTPFEINGEQIRWPHDPNASVHQTAGCRCTLGFRIVPKPGYGRLIAEAA